MKKQSVHQYARALYEITKEAGEKHMDEVLQAFVHLLAKDKMLSKIDRISTAFENYVRKQAGIVDINITAAAALEETQVNHIAKAFGSNVETTMSIDKSILGGFIVKTGDTVLDASVKTQLRRLEEHLVS